MLMSIDKSNEDKFEQILRRGLGGYSEPVPADFTEKILRQIKGAEERRLLARVILQERLALAGCIVLGVVMAVVAVVWGGTVAAFAGEINVIIAKIIQSGRTAGGNWQVYAVFAGVIVFVVYGLVDLLAGEG